MDFALKLSVPLESATPLNAQSEQPHFWGCFFLKNQISALRRFSDEMKIYPKQPSQGFGTGSLQQIRADTIQFPLFQSRLLQQVVLDTPIVFVEMPQ